METAAFVSIVDAIAKSSSAFLFVAVYVAWRALQAAKEAVTHIKEMRDTIVKAAPEVDTAVERVEDIHRQVNTMATQFPAMDMKMSALVARKQQG